ncbi:uncharacterized protein LOC127702526 [Mytilus californianus]|uniref:uncharacterized protein LOC127702526 n=1 Tax=Mytilus californianus TaxID=6549 RepID=UPI0022479BA1|nr:uncharacterized protein LOC127702526 [Mytilus californianus]
MQKQILVLYFEIIGVINHYNVYFNLKERTTTELFTETITAETANIEKSTALIHITTTITITTEKTTDVDRINSMQTDVNSDHGKKETATNSGPSEQEQFYYWLLGAGLVLVLCLSVICNACLNRKCRTKTKTLEHRSKDKSASDIQLNKIDEEEDNKPNVHGKAIMVQIEEESSYESIDENKMTHYDYPDQSDLKNYGKSPGLPIRPYLLSQSKPLYLDVVDDIDLNKVIGSIGDLSLNKTKSAEFGTSRTHIFLNTTELDNNAGTLSHLNKVNSKAIVQVHSEKKPESINLIDGDISSDDCDVTSVKTDEYLNPYVPLIPDEMEYLHSYTTPIKQELPPINKAASAIETQTNLDREHKPKYESKIESVNMNTKSDSGNSLNEKHSIYEDNTTDPYVPLNKNETDYLQTSTPNASVSSCSKTKSRCADTSTLNKVSSKNNFLTNEYEDGFSSNTNLSKV